MAERKSGSTGKRTSSASKPSGSKARASKKTTKQAPAEAKRPGFLQTLRHGWKPAHKRPTTMQRAAKKPATDKPSTDKRAAGASAAGTARGKQKTPPANVQERIEGVQGWMAEIERKQDRMTKVGGGAAIVALLASAAALALGVIGMQSSASDDDLDKLRDSVNALSSEVEQQTEQQLGGLNQKITALESQVKSLQQQQQQNASTISNLQGQVGRGGGAGADVGAGAGTAPALPDAQPDAQPDEQP